MNELLEKIIPILHSDSFGIMEKITPETIIKNLPGWDSIKHLTFLIEIETTFDIEIEPEEIKKVVTIADLMEKIKHDSPRT